MNSEELKAAAEQLGRKRRGAPGYNDDCRIARMQAGASARAVATSEGGRGAAATETRISRKKRKQTINSLYWAKMEELCDALVKISPSPTELGRYTEAIKRAGPPSAPHLILLDLAMCNLQRVVDGDRVSADDWDDLDRALFHGRMVTNSNPDSPARREKLSVRIRMIEAILRELRPRIT
jgi:hypothetical protein